MAHFIEVQRKTISNPVTSKVNVDHIAYYFADDNGAKLVLSIPGKETALTVVRVEETYEQISNLINRGNKEGMVY